MAKKSATVWRPVIWIACGGMVSVASSRSNAARAEMSHACQARLNASSAQTMMGLPCVRLDGRFFASLDRRTGALLIKLPACSQGEPPEAFSRSLEISANINASTRSSSGSVRVTVTAGRPRAPHL